jgi:Methyl-accepting chemotaxis protein
MLIMGLKLKAVLFVDACIILVCACIAFIGWRSADQGFDQALQMQAESNAMMVESVMDARFPGGWYVEGGALYKGDHRFGDNQEIADQLGEVCQGYVTFFAEDVRISTNLKNDKGERNVGTKADPKIAEAVLKGNSKYTGRTEILGKAYMSAYVPLYNQSKQAVGMIFVGVDRGVMDDVRSSFLMEIGFAAVAVIVIMSLLSYVILGRAITPISDLTAGLGRIAEGDLRGPNLDETSADEIGQLARSANRMKGHLHDVMSNVSRSAETVAASAEQLTASSHQTLESITQVADNTVHMAEGSAQQQDMVERLSGAADNMTAKIAQLSERAERVYRLAEESGKQTEEGQKQVENAVTQIQSIADQVSAAAAVVEALGKRSDEIGSIVDTISGISEQTNLLALNAAIEAARAGEAGRGFAVVAEEVRKLAEQSGISAKDIADRIAMIQRDTAEAVRAIQQGNENVEGGAAVVALSGEAFRSVAGHITELVHQIRRASEAVTEVNTTKDSMVASLKGVEEITKSAAEETQTVSAATEEQAATMNEIADASNTLAELAQRLQSEVQKFRL